MTLNFTLTANDTAAFTERFLRDSKSYQATRTRVRWVLPCLLVAMACFYTWRDGFSPIVSGIFGGMSVAWWLFYPLRLDARVRSNAKKLMTESSYSKLLGPYELQLLDEHLYSTSPLGSSTTVWSGVDRVAMGAEYLYIFQPGARGFPIRIAEIGQDAAQRAHDFVAERIEHSRQ